MTVLLYILGVLLFLIGLAVSIGLHELGHLVPGKLFNVKVTQYFIGFGKTLWSRQHGETEYGIKAIPLGGYCKLIGMVPPAAAQEAPAKEGRSGVFAQLVSDARSAEYDHLQPADYDRLFYDKPWWQRVIIMGSGVATNLVLAFVLFAVVLVGFGVPTPTTTVASVSKCVIAVTQANLEKPQRDCRSSDPRSPAVQAGFRPGDRFAAFNGAPIRTWRQIQREIRANGGKRAAVVVVRDGQRVTLHPTTVVSPRPDPRAPRQITRAGFLGITPTQTRVRQDLGFVVSTMGSATWQTLEAIGMLPVKVYHVGRAALGLEKRSIDSPMSVVGAGRVAGEVTAQHTDPIVERAMFLISLLAALNLFLGMINLVPLPPFDGGGIATTLYEAARRGIARLLHRPDPGAVDAAKLLPLTYVMAAVILLLSMVLVFADIVAPVPIS